MIRNEFTFHSVGQGLFYTGIIMRNKEKQYSFVFDCGTESSQCYLDEAINSYVGELNNLNKKNIDFAVLSHLDKDHIIGIFELQKKKNINKYYLPYIGKPGTVYFHYMFDLITNGNETSLGVEGEAFHWFRNIYTEMYERMYENRENEDNIISWDEFIEDDARNKYWRFHIFTKKVSQEKIKKFNDEITKMFGSEKSTEDIISLIKEKKERRELNKLYKKIFGGTNITSLVLIHYPLSQKVRYTEIIRNYFPNSKFRLCSLLPIYVSRYVMVEIQRFFDYYDCFRQHYSNENRTTVPTITVLTGDAEFCLEMVKKVEKILNENPKFWKLLQVPHHGSEDNWNNLDILKLKFEWYIIPFGYNNKHKLPDMEVTDELQTNFKKFAFVTQESVFMYDILTDN